RLLELHPNLDRALGEAFAGANEERDTGPAVIFDTQLERRERFDFRVASNARFVAIAAKLAPHHVLGIERLDRLYQAHLLLADSLDVVSDRRVHREDGGELEDVVLDDVADRPGLVVELAAALHAEMLGHRDLNVVDVVAAERRIQTRVREAE